MCSSYYRPNKTPTEAELVRRLFDEDIVDAEQMKKVLDTPDVQETEDK